MHENAEDVLSPALMTTLPPCALLPLPTTILRLPPEPKVAEPVRISATPLLPCDTTDPVLNASPPLTPFEPPLDDLILKVPLEVDAP